MSYTCPQCSLGVLQPTHSTYVRWWAGRLVTIPNFAAWRCDYCSYTRYDVAALARINLILGPDADALDEISTQHPTSTEGPGDRGPHRWSL